MADTKKSTADELICNLTNNVDQSLAILSLAIDGLPSVNFDNRIISALYAVESLLENVSGYISDVDNIFTELKNKKS